MADLMTYDGWMTAGRMVSKGEKAEFYLVSPCGRWSRPMFRKDQTSAPEVMDGVWAEVVPAAERPRSGASRDKRPKLKLTYTDEHLSLWCGPDKKAIAACKKDGFKFDKYSHRWVKKVSQEWFDNAQTAYEAAGYSVEVST